MPSQSPRWPWNRFAVALLIPALLLSMAGCSGWLDWDDEDNSAAAMAAALPARYVLTSQTPPMPLAEFVPWPSISSTQIWRPGYWIFDGVSFDWVPGAMIARPSPTAVWSPDRWVKHRYGWGFVAGYWQ